jgi:hypothetical protein
VTERLARTSWTLALATLLAVAACSSEDTQLQEHDRKLQSLEATASAIGEAWLAGSVASTYAATAFEQTFQLVEKERRLLAASPVPMANPRHAALVHAAESESRILVLLVEDVAHDDRESLRQHLTQIPRSSSGHA